MKSPRKCTIIFLITYGLGCAASHSQQAAEYKLVGNCEGCEAIFEYGNEILHPIDTLPDFSDAGPKLKITGTIYKPDGKTPAEGVILYIYHTDQTGVYPTKGNEKGWARRHGYIRGWVKTSADGRYTFYTLRPASYPNSENPQHIHPIVLEPDGKYYWLEDLNFADDPLLLARMRNPEAPRGGSSGVLHLQREGDLFVGRHDILLGKNVPGYSN